MYKTISIQQDTYQNLQAIAARLDKPKSQVIDELINGYIETMQADEKKKLQEFNAFMKNLIGQVKLPEGTKVSTDDLDSQFAALKDVKNYP
jgi:predicted CopG family antitoxin